MTHDNIIDHCCEAWAMAQLSQVGTSVVSARRKHRIPPELREAVNRYLSARLDMSVISTSAAAKEGRVSAPVCERVSDQELVEYVAERAVEAGFAVSFDNRELPQ